MQQDGISFQFASSVSMSEVNGTLRLAVMAVEALHGADRVRMEAKFEADIPGRAVAIDRSNEVGRTLALVFGGFVRREFGDEAVKVNHSTSHEIPARALAQASLAAGESQP